MVHPFFVPIHSFCVFFILRACSILRGIINHANNLTRFKTGLFAFITEIL